MNGVLPPKRRGPGSRTLGRQLTQLFTLLLALSLGAYGIYIGTEQADFVERMERQHTDELTHTLASVLEPHLASGDLRNALAHLLELEFNPHIRRATVTDRQGLPIASVRRPTHAAPFVEEDLAGAPALKPDEQRHASRTTTRRGAEPLVAWAGIGAQAPLGWLRIEVAPVAADNLKHIIIDSVLTGLLTVIAGTLAIRYFLRAPLRSLKRATAFAEGLEASQGDILQESSSITEVRQLVDALNRTSARLHEGQSALAASESRNRAVTEAALDSIISFDEDGRILEFNPAAERSFGIPRAEALGQQAIDLLFPERVRDTQIHALTDQLARPGPATDERQWSEASAMRRDGTEFPVEVALVPVDSAGHRLTTAYIRDISARKAAEAAMRQAKESAEATSRSKSDFLANMSHEIRTPMNAIIGMTDLALDTPLDEEQHEYLSLVKSSANSLLNIINDILDFSKIEAGKLDFESIDFSLRDCIGLAVRTLQQRATEKGLCLGVRIASGVPDSLRGDPHRLRQVLINLLSNGIKFTDRGEVGILVERAVPGGDGTDIALTFSVRDTGVGIPPEKQQLIFNAFSQADTSTTRRYGGTGLGLTISAQLVQAMGGRIEVDSTPGQGSVFHFVAHFQPAQAMAPIERQEELNDLAILVAMPDDPARARLIEQLTQWRMSPVTAADGAGALSAQGRGGADGRPFRIVLIDHQLPDMDGLTLARTILESALPPPAVIMLSDDEPDGDHASCRDPRISAHLASSAAASELLNAILLAVAAGSAPVRGHGPRPLRQQKRALHILLAEDNVVNQTLALHLLDKLGHQADVASNGLEALKLHAAKRYDLILMDVQMPLMGGFEATAKIRQREADGPLRTPIVAMTAHAMKGDRERCLEAGMDAYLSKPVHAPDLARTLGELTEQGGPPPTDATPASPRSREAADHTVFNRQALFINMAGDEALIRELIAMYDDDEPRLCTAMEAAIAAGDAAALRDSAHALKGAVANFCALRAQASAQRLESLARDGQIDEAPAALEDLREELARLREALEREGLRARP